MVSNRYEVGANGGRRHGGIMDGQRPQALSLGEKFIRIAYCAAQTWLFTSQALSSKVHRCAWHLMKYDMDLSGE